MENVVMLLALAALCMLLIRLAAVPLKLLAKVSLRGLLGLGCLWLLNSAAWFTGLTFPVNVITALLAGYLGIPGIALTALLGKL